MSDGIQVRINVDNDKSGQHIPSAFVYHEFVTLEQFQALEKRLAELEAIIAALPDVFAQRITGALE